MKRHISFVVANILLIIYSLTGCSFTQNYPSEDLVWVGVELILSSTASSYEPIQLFDKSLYTLSRSDLSQVVVNDPKQSNFCFPISLRSQTSPITGRSFIVRVTERSSGKEVAVLDFTQWNGLQSWWVHPIGDNSEGAECVEVK